MDASLIDAANAILHGHLKETVDPIDEERLNELHDKAYNEKEESDLDARDLGSAAALRIFRKFTSKENDEDSAASTPGGDEHLSSIKEAIEEAEKLFDSFGGPGGGGSKQDAVNSAATTVARLFAKRLGFEHSPTPTSE